MNKVLIVVAIVLIAGGAYFFFTKPAAAPVASQTVPVASKEFVFHVASKKVVDGPAVMSVTKGDTVVIRITNDEAEELHLHGYDKSVDLAPDVEATLTFVADTAGRFPAELEGSKTEITTLEVLP